MVSIIQQREQSYRDSNPDEIEIGKSEFDESDDVTPSIRLGDQTVNGVGPQIATSSTRSSDSLYYESPFLNALDVEIDLWTNCVKEISKLVMTQKKISKDILTNTIELRKNCVGVMVGPYSWKRVPERRESKSAFRHICDTHMTHIICLSDWLNEELCHMIQSRDIIHRRHSRVISGRLILEPWLVNLTNSRKWWRKRWLRRCDIGRTSIWGKTENIIYKRKYRWKFIVCIHQKKHVFSPRKIIFS